MRQLSADFLAALHAPETGEVIVALLKVEHSAIATLYLCNDNAPFVTGAGHPAGAHTWQPFPFMVQMPDQTPDQLPLAKLTIDVIGLNQQIIVAIRTAPVTEPIRVTFYLHRATAPDAPEIEFPSLHWRGIEYAADVCQGDLSLPESFTEEPFPTGTFNPNNFPGLF